MNQDLIITLPISETGTPPQFHYHVKVNGKVVASNQTLSPEDTRAVRDISNQYGELFEGRRAPELSAETQTALGRELFDLWLAPYWDEIKLNVPSGSRRVLVIASQVPDVLNSPWELLLPPEGDFLGVNPLFSIRRLPKADKLAEFQGALRARPLRLLFMACSPIDQHPLDYELEEEHLLRAVSGAGVAFDSGDLGTFDELCERVDSFQPHVVHLTGHGIVKDREGWFCFEDETGRTDLRSSKDISLRLAGSGVQCVFVSGCQTGKSPPIEAIGGVCQGLVKNEIPLAIGWAASIADDLATQFAKTFYGTLAASHPVDRAMVRARQEIWDMCKNEGNPSWTLPTLYSGTNQGLVVDPDLQRRVEEPPRSTLVLLALPGMKEGYAEHFVGRRREQQRLIPALRDGKLQVLIITGLGGSGKSALATRLARKLETEGFTPIPVPGSREVPLNSGMLLDTCAEAFRQAADKLRARGEEVRATELEAASARLEDDKVPVKSRLRQVVATLNSDRFLLVLDNFESNLDENSRAIIDRDLAEFYKHLVNNLSGKSRAIVTTRYQPTDVAALPAGVREENLGDFKESAFIKILRRDDKVDQRYRSGELPMDLLRELYQKFGGTPRFLLQIREAIKDMAPSELKAELDGVDLPDDADPGKLQTLRNKYFDSIFTSRLYSYLDSESQKALSRSAVYGVAVNEEGLAAASGQSLATLSGFITTWQDRAFVYPDTETAPTALWSVYGLLRGWLLDQLSAEERKLAHQAAGDFLRDLEKGDLEWSLGLSWVAVLQEARVQYLQAGDLGQARGLTDRISGFFLLRGLYDNVRQINLELLDYESHPSPMAWIGRSYSDQGEYEAAREWLQSSLDASGDEPNIKADALHNLATIDIYQGIYEEAQDKLMTALQIRQQIGDEDGEADTWHNLATIDLYQGNYQDAQAKLKKALVISQQIKTNDGEAKTWHQLANIDLYQGNYQEAQAKFKISLEIKQQIGDKAGEAKTWHSLATIDLNQGNYQEAQGKFKKSLEIKQQIGDKAGEAATWNNLGILAASEGRISEGLRLVALCYLIDRSIGHGDLDNDFSALSEMAEELGYTQEQFDDMLQEVAESYQRDLGKGMLEVAFKL